jgi:diguanylate cyclase (GGDEF)-like protein
MSLDVNTLFLMTMYIEAILGLLLLLAWLQNAGTGAMAWWGAAHLMRSLSVALYGTYGTASDLVSIDLAGALLFTSFGVTWAGVRIFDGRQPRLGALLAGATVWIGASQIPGLLDSGGLRSLLSACIIAGFSWAAAFEFWRGRDESLMSRWPAILLLFAHGAMFLMRRPLSAAIPDLGPQQPSLLSSAWLTVLSAEALLFSIAIPFVLLAMAKERTELRHKNDARIDALTGLANRRAFLQDAQQITGKQAAHGHPVAVFLIDLDHFKSVNDRFGHATGDHVLRLFAEVAAANLRSVDLVGRLGGEEFAVLLADASRDNAFVVAERIRSAFELAAMVTENKTLQATVSIGVAIIQDPEQDLTTLLAEADQALYRAKARGRNRVELSPVHGDEPSKEVAGASPAGEVAA